MDLKQQILHLYRVDELSLREIARRNGEDSHRHRTWNQGMHGRLYGVLYHCPSHAYADTRGEDGQDPSVSRVALPQV